MSFKEFLECLFSFADEWFNLSNTRLQLASYRKDSWEQLFSLHPQVTRTPISTSFTPLKLPINIFSIFRKASVLSHVIELTSTIPRCMSALSHVLFCFVFHSSAATCRLRTWASMFANGGVKMHSRCTRVGSLDLFPIKCRCNIPDFALFSRYNE